MKIAVCDIGSNTIKMKIYDCSESKAKEVFSSVVNAKLISYIKDGNLTSDGLMLLCNTVKTFQKQAKEQNALKFYPFATASLRRCKNSETIIDTVYDVCSVKIDLVSGNDEAFLSFMGVKNTMEDFPDNAILLDMGGGSTEIVQIEKQNKTDSYSMGFGSLSLSLDFDSFEKINDYSKETVLKYFPNTPITENAILVGGTALAINKLYNRYFSLENSFVMEYDKLVLLYDYLKKYDSGVLEFLKTHVPDRVTTVVQGLSAYIGIFEVFSVKQINVTTCGIREGYLYEKILKQTENL